MRPLRFSAPLLGAMLLLSAGPANAQTTLRFNSLLCTSGDYVTGGPVYTESGFQLTFSGPDLNTSYASWCSNVSNFPGSAAIFENYAGFGITLTRIGGAVFTLNSIDLAPVYSGGGVVTFTGNQFGGGVLLADQHWDDAAPNPALRTDPFTSWSNLTSVTFAQGNSSYFQFDNIVLDGSAGSVTPEPSTMGLLATGLVGMVGAGARRRKKR